jgi:seryl-tRNA synthetase
MTVDPLVERQSGLVALNADTTALLQLLDTTFEQWGHQAGAVTMTTPALLPTAALAKLDYFDNFPHQAMLAAPLDLATGPVVTHESTAFPSEALGSAELTLPPAACYGVYLFYEDKHVRNRTAITVVGRCFRQEERYEGLRRLLGFHMREVVMIGTREAADQHLAEFTDRIISFAEALGLSMSREAASDPFYDRGGSKALLQRLSPVKHEFVVDGLAIASTNIHRNFFGERCSIRLEETDEAACTSCVAFGLERWVSVLIDRFSSVREAAEAVLHVTTSLS